MRGGGHKYFVGKYPGLILESNLWPLPLLYKKCTKFFFIILSNLKVRLGYISLGYLGALGCGHGALRCG